MEEIIMGVADAEPIDYAPKETPFIKKNADRTDPKKYLPAAKSVIVIGVPYQAKFDFKPNGRAGGAPRGKIAQFALDGDYHVFVKEKLLEILKPLNCEYKIFVDSGKLYEKGFAVKAGIGFIGKNSLVVSEKFGSFIFLGVALTSVKLEISDPRPVKNRCGNCELCVKACPNGALTPYELDYKKCVSYLTQNQNLTQKKGETNNLRGYLYGCDICQSVCPFNAGKFVKTIRDINFANPELSYIINLTEDEFKLKYGKTPLNWRGLEILKRNARLNLSNKG
jgi:epoxyqueuosine reductase